MRKGDPASQGLPFSVSEMAGQSMEKILFVDYDSVNLNLMKNVLHQEGMSVHCAENGNEALAKLNQKSFDLMITDFDMPVLNGLSLTRQVAVIAPDMPVILMTGNISSEIPHVAKKAGVARVLGKPFSREALLEAVREVT